ncbi:preprotein translocase subunit SecE [Priestia megaterium]|nr:preprotein translocase subunit SecE [Priestia megaterium]
MNGKIHKVFLAIFGVSAILFAILFLTDYLIQITRRN